MKNEIEILSSTKTKYSEYAREDAVSSITLTLQNVKVMLGGSSEQKPRVKEAVCRAVDAFEARNVSERELSEVVRVICENEALLVMLFSDTGTALEALPLLGEIYLSLGLDRTNRLVYDILLIYCQYMEQKYTELYEFSTSKPEHLLRNALEWKERHLGLTRVGEDNFCCIFGVGTSAISAISQLDSSQSDFTEKLGAGEMAVYLRSVGKLLSKHTLTTDDTEFLINFIGEFNISPVFKILSKSGMAKNAAGNFNNVCGILSKSLLGINADDAKLLESGKTSEFLYLLFMNLNENEKELIDGFFESIGDSEAYMEYFEKNGLKNEFLSFCKDSEKVTFSQLWQAQPSEFSQKFAGYLAFSAPAIAFTVYGYDKG